MDIQNMYVYLRAHFLKTLRPRVAMIKRESLTLERIKWKKNSVTISQISMNRPFQEDKEWNSEVY